MMLFSIAAAMRYAATALPADELISLSLLSPCHAAMPRRFAAAASCRRRRLRYAIYAYCALCHATADAARHDTDGRLRYHAACFFSLIISFDITLPLY